MRNLGVRYPDIGMDVRPALVSAALLLPALTGCGSSASSPFTVSCVTHRLPGGAIRAHVIVTNRQSLAARAIIYGPAFLHIQHVHPVLAPALVAASVHGNRATYIGFAVPHVDSKAPTHLILRFAPFAHPHAILVADRTSIHASSWSFLDNPSCLIR